MSVWLTGLPEELEPVYWLDIIILERYGQNFIKCKSHTAAQNTALFFGRDTCTFVMVKVHATFL